MCLYVHTFLLAFIFSLYDSVLLFICILLIVKFFVFCFFFPFSFSFYCYNVYSGVTWVGADDQIQEISAMNHNPCPFLLSDGLRRVTLAEADR